MTDLFAGLISSKTRIKLLVRFFFNPGTKAYLRELAKELRVSTNAVREELNQLTHTKLLTSEKDGRNVYYSANHEHPLFPELRSRRCTPRLLCTPQRPRRRLPRQQSHF